MFIDRSMKCLLWSKPHYPKGWPCSSSLHSNVVPLKATHKRLGSSPKWKPQEGLTMGEEESGCSKVAM